MNLSRLFHCSVFNVLCLFDSLFILSKRFRRVKNFFNFFIFHHSVINRAIYILSCRSCFVNTFLSFFLSFCLHPTVSDESASDERRRRDLNPRAAVNDLHPFQGCPFGQLGYFSSRIFFIFIFKHSSKKDERREWDSNPRALADKRFSRPPRYDHFDISPTTFPQSRELCLQLSRCFISSPLLKSAQK